MNTLVTGLIAVLLVGGTAAVGTVVWAAIATYVLHQ